MVSKSNASERISMKTTTIKALEHALIRLNAIPHKYADTNFKLIESALKEQYENEEIVLEERLAYLR